MPNELVLAIHVSAIRVRPGTGSRVGAPSRTEFRLAGSMELRRGSLVVSESSLGGRHHRLTMAMLLLERRQPVASGFLADELWPRDRPRTWRSSLRNAISEVRSSFVEVGLPAGTLDNRDGRYVVDIPDLHVDVESTPDLGESSTRLVAAGRIHEACDLARRSVEILCQPILADIDSDWLDRLRDELLGRRVDALLLQARCERRRGDFGAARQAAGQARDHAPLREECWRELIRVEVGAGNSGAALEVYGRCRRRLAEDLGTEPDAATRQLHEQLLGAGTDGPRADPTSTPSMSTRPVPKPASERLFGRERLLRDVVEALASGRSVLLRGPAGVGKTRLAAEVVSTPGVAGRRVDRIMGSTGLADVALGTLGALATDIGAARVPRSELVGRFLAHWRAQESDEPALVWLDDAHHADDLSAAILRHAVVTGALQVLSTQRPADPLGQDLSVLLTEGLMVAVDVPPLSETAAGELVEHLLVDRASPEHVERLVALGDGNPLYLRELATSWRADAPDAPFETVERLVARPIRRLSSSRRRMAELIALAEPLPADILASRGDDLGVLIRRGLVRRHGPRDLRIDHPLRSAWLLAELGAASPQAYRDLAELATNSTSQRSESIDPLRLVDWELRGGLQPDRRRLVEATRAAIGRGDAERSERFSRAVIGPERELLRAQSMLLSSGRSRGLAALERVRHDGSDDARVEAALWLARDRVVRSDREGARAVLDETSDDLAPSARRRLLLGKLWVWTFGRIPTDDDVTAALERATSTRTDQYRDELLTMALAVAYQRQDPWELVDHLNDVVEAEADGGLDLIRRSRMKAVVCGYWLIAGRIDQALDTVVEHLPEVLDRRVPESIALMSGVGAFTLALGGRHEEGVRVARSAPVRVTAPDWFRQGRLTTFVLVGNECYLGHAERNRVDLETLDGDPADGFFIAPLLRARARILVCDGSGATAPFDELVAALRGLEDDGKYGWGPIVAAELTDRSTPRPVLEVVRASASRIETRGLARVVAVATTARLEDDVSSLLAAGECYERMRFAPAALRAYADVLARSRMDDRTARAALVGAIRVLRDWDGIDPWWFDESTRLPRVAVVHHASLDQERAPSEAAERARQEIVTLVDVASWEALRERLRPLPVPDGAPEPRT